MTEYGNISSLEAEPYTQTTIPAVSQSTTITFTTTPAMIQPAGHVTQPAGHMTQPASHTTQSTGSLTQLSSLDPTNEPANTEESIFDFFAAIPTGVVMLILLAMASALVLVIIGCLILTTICCIVCYRHGKRQSQPANVFAPSINPYFQNEDQQADIPDPIYELEEKDTSKLVITNNNSN